MRFNIITIDILTEMDDVTLFQQCADFNLLVTVFQVVMNSFTNVKALKVVYKTLLRTISGRQGNTSCRTFHNLAAKWQNVFLLMVYN